MIAEKYKLKWLPSDFKKKDGFKRSTELSEKYGLYRQDYCGCLFSKAERDVQKSLSGVRDLSSVGETKKII